MNFMLSNEQRRLIFFNDERKLENMKVYGDVTFRYWRSDLKMPLL
jgi:hypothetical protein